MERQQWEKRLEEEKEKNSRKIRDINEEWGRRMGEERETLEGALQELT